MELATATSVNDLCTRRSSPNRENGILSRYGVIRKTSSQSSSRRLHSRDDTLTLKMADTLAGLEELLKGQLASTPTATTALPKQQGVPTTSSGEPPAKMPRIAAAAVTTPQSWFDANARFEALLTRLSPNGAAEPSVECMNAFMHSLMKRVAAESTLNGMCSLVDAIKSDPLQMYTGTMPDDDMAIIVRAMISQVMIDCLHALRYVHACYKYAARMRALVVKSSTDKFEAALKCVVQEGKSYFNNRPSVTLFFAMLDFVMPDAAISAIIAATQAPVA